MGLGGCEGGFSCTRYIDGFVDITIVGVLVLGGLFVLIVGWIVWDLVVGFGWFCVGSWGFVC